MRALWNFYNNHFRYFEIICIVFALVMMLHFKIMLRQDQTALICFLVFLVYFISADLYAKNRPVALLPVWIYLISYYIINWATFCEMIRVLWNVFLG